MERILTIDPGERVGWAVGTIGGQDDSLHLGPHGITGLKPFAIKLASSFNHYDTVIYETWRLSAKAAKTMIGNDMQTSQLIGIIRYFSWLWPDTKLVSQAPTKKRTGAKVAPEQMQQIMKNAPGSHDDAHDIDALLHLSYYHWRTYVADEQTG